MVRSILIYSHLDRILNTNDLLISTYKQEIPKIRYCKNSSKNVFLHRYLFCLIIKQLKSLKKDALIKELKEKRVMELNEKGAAGSSAYQVAPCLAHCFM